MFCGGEGEATPSVRFPVGNRCTLNRIIEERLIKGLSGFREPRGNCEVLPKTQRKALCGEVLAGAFGTEPQPSWGLPEGRECPDLSLIPAFHFLPGIHWLNSMACQMARETSPHDWTPGTQSGSGKGCSAQERKS